MDIDPIQRVRLIELLGMALICSVEPAAAETRISADYAVSAETQDAGGRRLASANYVVDGSIGSIGGIGMVADPPLVAKSGYIGQLYDQSGFVIGASPTNVNEATSRQLVGAQVMDDGTFLLLEPSSVSWGIVSGPINVISPDGLATAGYVYQDTSATVSGSAFSFAANLGLVVANVTSDDFGLYAGDGIDDDWQVFYFGEANPLAAPGNDVDNDGGNNLFEFLALTIPTDASSLFQLRAMPTQGQSSSLDIIFGPIRVGRTYSVQYSLNLRPDSWAVLTDSTQRDDGEERVLTDPGAGGPRKFYRVQIGR